MTFSLFPFSEPLPPVHHYNQLNVFTHQVSTPAVDFRGPVFLNMNPYARPPFRHQRPDVDDQALWVTPPPEDVSDRFSEEGRKSKPDE